jgi:uncharacterized membrane protein HdeD (DUF308 family)
MKLLASLRSHARGSTAILALSGAICVVAAAVLLVATPASAASLTEVTGFGTNPSR